MSGTAATPERSRRRSLGADKTAYGPIPHSDPSDEVNDRSERGRAVVVLKSGCVEALRGRCPRRWCCRSCWCSPRCRSYRRMT